MAGVVFDVRTFASAQGELRRAHRAAASIDTKLVLAAREAAPATVVQRVHGIHLAPGRGVTVTIAERTKTAIDDTLAGDTLADPVGRDAAGTTPAAATRSRYFSCNTPQCSMRWRAGDR